MKLAATLAPLALPLLLLGSPRSQGAWGVAYAPADTSEPRPPVLYLHGMWTTPEEQCAYFVRPAAPFGALVCPRGNALSGEAGRMWTGNYTTVAPNVHAALDAAGRAGAAGVGPLDRSGGGTIVGYSNGAYFAVEVAYAEKGKWTGLVLLSMHLELDVARLKAAGVRRVVLAAGDKDDTRVSMRALAEKTDAAGLPARFVSLGPGGHPLTAQMEGALCEAIAWVREADAGKCGEGGP